MALHRNIKKSLLFTAYFVNGNLTSVRCNLTGRFVKRNIYFAIEKDITIDFNAISLFGVVTSNNYINVLNVLFLALFGVLAASLINLFL